LVAGGFGGYYELSSIKLIFSSAGNFRYIVALSYDALNWTETINRSQTIRTDATRNDVFDPGMVSRYVQINFVAVPPGGAADYARLKFREFYRSVRIISLS